MDIKNLEKILKSLANKRRLAILQYLKRNADATVGEIAGTIKLSLKATSRHLFILSAAELVEKEQRSLFVHYRLSEISNLIVRSVLQQL